MVDARIEPIGQNDVGIIVDMYNQVFSPAVDNEFFQRRFRARFNVTILVAVVEDRPVGFMIGFELTPTTYYCWIGGVMPDFRGAGIGTQLMQALIAWSHQHDYHILRFECQNQHRPMLHVAITEGFDLVGIRWDTSTSHNVVIFEKDLR